VISFKASLKSTVPYQGKRESKHAADHCRPCQSWAEDESMCVRIIDSQGQHLACGCTCHVRIVAGRKLDRRMYEVAS